MEKVPCVVIGGGVVGLAVARAMSLSGIASIVLEKHSRIGLENSSHNSEVIHSGIYYPSGSLKSKLCIQGKQLLFDYMKHNDISHRMCGKIIVATAEDEVSTLHSIYENGVRCGLKDLQILSPSDIRFMEPSVQAVMGIHSPSTSICDSHGLMCRYAQDIEDYHSNIVCNCEVHQVHLTDKYESTQRSSSMFEVHTSQGTILCDMLVNAAGLYAQKISAQMSFYPKQIIPGCYYAKGTYYKLQGLKEDKIPPIYTSSPSSSTSSSSSSSLSSPSESMIHASKSNQRQPFRRLIYPIPSVGGLGIHATIDLMGQVKFGPDVEWILAPIRSSDSNNDNTIENSNDSDNGNHINSDATTRSRKNSPYKFSITSSPYSSFTVEDKNLHREQMFYDQVSKYWPIVHDYKLVPDYAGIRPKLAPPPYSYDASVSHHDASITNYVGDSATKVDMINTGSSTTTTTTTPSTGTKAKKSTTNSNTSMTTDQTYDISSTSDFNIFSRPHHGIPNLVCLYGIESPGLTSSLAIGNYVRDILLADKT